MIERIFVVAGAFADNARGSAAPIADDSGHEIGGGAPLNGGRCGCCHQQRELGSGHNKSDGRAQPSSNCKSRTPAHNVLDARK